MFPLQANTTLAVKLGLPIEEHHQTHPWGIFFTILGTVLLDFDADSCQSPSRAYLLDVTVPGKSMHRPTHPESNLLDEKIYV
jgi:hypothetical protein